MRFGAEALLGGTGRPRALAHGRPRGWGNWQRSGKLLKSAPQSAGAPVPAHGCYAAYCVAGLSDKLANAGG